ncbi:MAG: hypothetical protein ACRD2L_20735, partial [Terriglobia bacterium]
IRRVRFKVVSSSRAPSLENSLLGEGARRGNTETLLLGVDFLPRSFRSARMPTRTGRNARGPCPSRRRRTWRKSQIVCHRGCNGKPESVPLGSQRNTKSLRQDLVCFALFGLLPAIALWRLARQSMPSLLQVCPLAIYRVFGFEFAESEISGDRRVILALTPLT